MLRLPAHFVSAGRLFEQRRKDVSDGESLQKLVRSAWSSRFPLDSSVQLITDTDTLSARSQMLARVTQMSNEEIAALKLPAKEVWPFQRAVMFLAIESWRVRFAPFVETGMSQNTL